MIRRFALFVLLSLLPMLAAAQALQEPALPAARYIYAPDTDFPGQDLQALFDTTQDACARACTAAPACTAFTFNARSGACFLKSGASGAVPYAGAISARKIAADPALLAAAPARLRALPFIGAEDIARARALVDETAQAFPAGTRSEAEIVQALARAMASADHAAMRQAAGALASLRGSSSAWVNLSAANLRLPQSLPRDLRLAARRDAVPAALNAVLRAASPEQEATALDQLATALEASGRGKDMIAALRRASALAPRADLAARLEDAIQRYGFRLLSHQVDNDSAAPRICATFSEPLARAGVAYDSYVQVPGMEVVTETSGAQLCVLGVQHGQSYDLRLRAGLPAASGEVTARATDLQLYVRDRSASVRFAGRGYVLPRLGGGEAGALPVTTVNAADLDLVLRRVSDRNLLRALQENLFARPLSAYAEDRLASDLAVEIWRGSAEVRSTLNADTVTRLPLGEMVAEQGPGIYALTARIAGQSRYDSAAATQWFVLSDLGLSTLQGTGGLHVAVRGLGDAAAREGVRVTLISQANAVLGEAVTDAQGLAVFEAGLTRGRGGAAPALVVARTQDEGDLAFLPLTGPAFDLSDRGVEGRPAPGPIDAFLATDRGAYRAGEHIGATVLLRDQTGTGAVDGLPLVAVLQRPDGVEYSRTRAQASGAGGAVFGLPLGADVPRGTWRLDIVLGADTPPLASTTLLVEDFLPERIDMELALPGGALPRAAPPALGLSARYLFGAPAAGLQAEGDLRLRPVRAIEGWPGYLFGSQDSTAGVEAASLGPVRTDAAGQARVPLPLPSLDEVSQVVQAEITLRLAEGSGRPIERRISRALARSQPVLGLKPGFEDIAAEDSEASFDLVALDPGGQPRAGTVSWVLSRIETRYQWYQLYGDWNWEPITTRTRVASGETKLDGAPARLSVPVAWGAYEVIAELDGTQAASALRFTAGWHGGDGSDTPDRLQVALDRRGYAVGDTARLHIDTERGGTALVTVLTGDVAARQVVEIPDGGARVPLEVTEAWGHGAYVTASLLRPLASGDPAPARALGLAHARVARAEQRLAVAIDAPRVVDGQPGSTEVAVRVDGAAPGQQAYVTLAAVDLGILNLTAHDSPDPTGHFFGQRQLGVDLRDLYGRLIDGQAGPLGTVRSGGDAGAQMRMQAPPPSEATMVFFSGLVEVGADGAARLSIPRPAFNGTLRLDAIAWTESAVGQASTEIVARDPVVVTASLPRFLAPGDASRLLLEVQATEALGGPVVLEVAGTGVALDSAAESLTLADGQSVRREVPLRAGPVGEATIALRLRLPDGRVLARTLSLGVRQNDPEIATTRRFTLNAGNTFRFDEAVFVGLRAGTGQAVVSAGPLARLDVPGLLELLDRVPYGCTEQITSAALPLLTLGDFAPDADVRAQVEQAIARVLTRQAGTGGFGLWRAEAGAFWLDAYVSDFLQTAQASGYDVPQTALRLALNNLQNRINYAPDFDSGGDDIAYALHVLAKGGAASIADLRYYADAKRMAFATPLASAQLGAALASYGDTQRSDAMFARAAAQLAQASDARRWREDFGSALSDRAAVLRLALQAGSAAVDTGALAQTLVATRSPSTQEAAQLLLAAGALRAGAGVSGLRVDGVPVSSGPVVLRRADAGSAVAAEITNTASGPVDLTLTTFGVPQVAPEAGGAGYAITRQMFTPEGDEVSGPAQTGDQRIVVLTVTPFDETRARLMVEDPLPAGFEIDNPNLLRAGSLRGLDWLEVAETQHAEFLADRFRAAVDVQGTGPVHLAYKLRAVTPGDYHHPAASVHDMYRPDLRAVTGTARQSVTR